MDESATKLFVIRGEGVPSVTSHSETGAIRIVWHINDGSKVVCPMTRKQATELARLIGEALNQPYDQKEMANAIKLVRQYAHLGIQRGDGKENDH